MEDVSEYDNTHAINLSVHAHLGGDNVVIVVRDWDMECYSLHAEYHEVDHDRSLGYRTCTCDRRHTSTEREAERLMRMF